MSADVQGSGRRDDAPDLLPDLSQALMRELGPLIAKGERQVTVTLSKGKIRRLDIHLGPLRPAEIVDLARLAGPGGP